MAPEPSPLPRAVDAIKFVGLVIQEADGTVRAVDLSGDDLWLKVDVDIPCDEGPVIAFGLDSTYRNVGLPERIDVKVTGHRRLRGAPGHLATMRTVPPGEPPFPALTVRDDDPVTGQYGSADHPDGCASDTGASVTAGQNAGPLP